MSDSNLDEVIKVDLFKQDLTEAEKKFILYYLESFNATQAYLKAYKPAVKSTAYSLAALVLDRPHVRQEIKRLKKLMARKYDIDPTRYIEYQLKGANADISDYITFKEEDVPVRNPDGSIMIDPDTGEMVTRKVNKMHLADSDTVDTTLIQEIKSGRDGINIKLVDKQKCWENIKNFFEWHAQEKKKENNDNSLLQALHDRVDDSWAEDEDVDKDLKETIKR